MVKRFENRDLECASDVSRMAWLGRFDTEFLLYGSAIQETDGKIYYYATANQERLYHRMQRALADERYFLPMVTEKRRSPVPSGMLDILQANYKVALIQRMKRSYDVLLPRLQPFFQTAPNDQAYALLLVYQERIDGYFDDAKLQLFQGLVDMSYEGKILNAVHYQAFCAWIEKVRCQMSGDPREEDNITRVFYGFAYDDGGTLRYVTDAQEMSIVNKRNDLRLKCTVAPIVKRQYAVKQSYELSGARKKFSNWLHQVQDAAFMQWVRILRAMDGVIDKQALLAMTDGLDEQAADAARVVQYFDAVWNGTKSV